jgi:hypothetical protein
MAPPADRPGTNLADARHRLGESMARELRSAAPVAVPRAAAPRGLAGRLRTLLAPRPRAAWAAAVVVASLVLATVFVVRQEPAEDALRGATPGRDQGVVELEARTAQGVIELRWRAVPGADEYRVSLLATDLSPIATVPGIRETVAVLSPRDLAPVVRTGDLVYGQVVAFRMGSPIAESPPVTVRAP